MSDQRLGRPRTITRDIEDFLASAERPYWSPLQVWQKLVESGATYSPDAVQVAMTRMLHRHELERVSYGVYKLNGVEIPEIEFDELIARVPDGLSVHQCSACGAMVTDTDKHAQWHEEQR